MPSDSNPVVGRTTAGEHSLGAASLPSDISQCQIPQHELLKAVFESSAGFLGVLAPDGTVIDVNPAPLRVAGFRREDVVGRKLWETPFWSTLPDAQAEIKQDVLQAAQGEASCGEWRFATADGSQRVADRTLTPFKDDDGRVVMIVAEGRDITDRKQAELALSESEQRLRRLLDYAPGAIVLLDVDRGRFMDANENAERMFGLSREQLLQVGPGETSPPLQPDGRPSAEHIPEKLQATLASGNHSFEWWHRNAAGEDFLCEITLVQLPWSGRRIVCATLRDITEQRRIEKVIQGRGHVLERLARGASLQEVLNLLVETIEEQFPGMLCSVLLLDRETGRLRHGAAPSLPAFYNEAVDGLEIGPQVGSCGAAAYCGQRVVVADVLQHPNWAPYRELVVRTDLRACWSEPILASDDKVLGTFAMYYRQPREPSPAELGVIHTAAQVAGIAIEHKRAEQALRELNRSLEQRVQERTQELNAINEELKHSNRDLQQFAYAASHDLREPLRAVTGFSELLRQRCEGKLDANADDFIAHIVDGATRMQELLDGLLAYSRLGTQRDAVAPVDAAEAAELAVANLRTAIDDTEAEVRCGSLPVVYVDRTQLIQLFQNLISNAIKYRSARRPQIQISAERCDGFWQIDVQDNGIGIAAQYQDRIFDIFDRLHTREEIPGTGIGLALCKRIVDRHGGRIWVTSQPDEGSTFSFTLPAEPSYVDAAD